MMNRLFLSILAVFAFATSAFAQQTARLQVIHNAADQAAAAVDVYVGDELVLNDFAFRTASPFAELPAGVPLTVGIAPSASISVNDTIKKFTITLEPNGTYLAIANGVITPDAFAPNPSGADISFSIYAIPNARAEASNADQVDVLVFHGCTDAGPVDVYAGPNKIVSELAYNKASSYLSVPPGTYPLAVAPAGGSPIARYIADVSTLTGSAITIVASGFLDAGANGGGPAFGLFAVTSEGGPFIPLPPQQTTPKARVQIVHNAADPAAAAVDVYVNGELAVNDFAFRTVTPTLELEPGQEYTIGVAPSTSASAADTLKSFKVALPAGLYVVFANGVVQQGFAANPGGADIGFTIFPITGIRPVAQSEGNIDVIVFHGVTDAPAVDIRTGDENLVSGLAYGKNTEYISVPAAEYVIGVAPTGGNVIASYRVAGTALAGQSAVIFASGFLDPAANKNGPGFGLYALIAGNILRLPVAAESVVEVPSLPNTTVSPNPASTSVQARFTMPHDGSVRIRLTDLTGSTAAQTSVDGLSAGNHVIPMSVGGQAAGSYLMTIDAGTHRSVVPVAVVR
ncbi:MAG: DUF4397 domain-containing protein [Candidatus Kapabacteria bacterium]|nr:DUF4397 domain-containing protein [Candidatus Kapabacteria bacterium]